jgi:hypothetical protein
VREARGLDEDGSELLRSITLTGQPLETATVTIIEAIEQKGYLDAERNEVIISSTKAFEEAEVDESAIGETVKQAVTRTIEEKRPKEAKSIQVAAIVTPSAVREEAMTKGLSAGKYAIYLSAKNSGNEIDLEQLKKGSVKEAVKQADSLGGLFNMEDLTKKEALVKLLEAEKRGELDEKVKKAKQLAKDKKPVAVSNDNESSSHKGDDPEDDGPKGRNNGKNGDHEKKGDNKNKNDNENRGDNEKDRKDRNGNDEKNGNGGEQNGNNPKQESKEGRLDPKNAANRGNSGNNENSGDSGRNGNSGNRENFGNASSSAAGTKSDWNDGRAILSGLKFYSNSENEKGQKNSKDQNRFDGSANNRSTSASRGIENAGLINARGPNGDKPANGENGNRNNDRVKDKEQDKKDKDQNDQNDKSKKDNDHRDQNSKTSDGGGQNGKSGNAGNMKGESSGKGSAFRQ